MRKSLLIFIGLFLLIALGNNVNNIHKFRKVQSRGLVNEPLSLELLYLGTCKQFIEKDLNSIRISKHESGECLPLKSNGGSSLPFTGEFIDPDLLFPDNNDLQIDYLCTDIEGPRALIHFVEIYESPSHMPVTNYILSIVPSSPFRATNKNVIYVRRPSCTTDKEFCSPYNERVTSCTPNIVQFGAVMEKGKNFVKKAFVISKDRIYLSLSANAPALCDTDSCCSYINPRSNFGMCPFQTGDFILPFLEDFQLHTSDHHKEHHKNKHGVHPVNDPPKEHHGDEHHFVVNHPGKKTGAKKGGNKKKLQDIQSANGMIHHNSSTKKMSNKKKLQDIQSADGMIHHSPSTNQGANKTGMMHHNPSNGNKNSNQSKEKSGHFFHHSPKQQ